MTDHIHNGCPECPPDASLCREHQLERRVAELEAERKQWRDVGVLEKNTELARENARLAKHVAELEAQLENKLDRLDVERILRERIDVLTPQQWAEVLSVLPPETQDGITDALITAGVTWGTPAYRGVASQRSEWRVRAERAERERDEAQAQIARYEAAARTW